MNGETDERIGVESRPASHTSESHVPQPKLYPSLFQAVGLLVGAILLQLTLTLASGLLFAGPGEGLPRNPGVWGLLNLLAFGPIIYYGWKRAGASRDIFPLYLSRWSLLAPMTVLLAGMGIATSEADNVTQSFLASPPEALDISWMFAGADRSLLGLLLLLVVVAPVTEELLFRGIILRGFLSRYSVVTAVTLSALLFALFHLNPWQFIGAFALGLVFGWWYVKTRSLVPCLVGHGIFNGFPVILSFALPPLPGFSMKATDVVQFQPLWFDLTGLALIALGAAWLWHDFRAGERQAREMADGSKTL